MRGALTATLAALMCAVPAMAGDYQPPKDVPVKADQVRARAIVLRVGDLPGHWRPSESSIGLASNVGPGAGCPGLDLDASGITRTGAAKSPDFEQGSVLVASTADVMRTVKEARSWIGGGFSPVMLRCMRGLLAGEMKGEFQKVGLQAVARLQPLRTLKVPHLVEQTTSMRAAFSVSSEGVTFNVVYDVIILRHGRITTALHVINGDGVPSSALELQLTRKLASRMQK